MPVRFNIHQAMISSSADAEKRTYNLFTGKSGKRWLVADQPNAADNIYVEGGPNSDGMAGRTLTFPLSEGGSVDLKGPWKTGADGLLKDTGQDVTGTYTSRGIVARYRVNATTYYAPDFYIGVLHLDDAPVIGPWNRVQRIAQEFANKTGGPVFYAVKTHGGGAAGQRQPQPVT